MPGNNPIHVSGKGVSVFIGAMCVLGAFGAWSAIGFWSGLGLFVFGIILILLGVTDF